MSTKEHIYTSLGSGTAEKQAATESFFQLKLLLPVSHDLVRSSDMHVQILTIGEAWGETEGKSLYQSHLSWSGGEKYNPVLFGTCHGGGRRRKKEKKKKIFIFIKLYIYTHIYNLKIKGDAKSTGSMNIISLVLVYFIPGSEVKLGATV